MATSISDRGRGKNKQYWNDDEGEALVDVLQELACDPLWKVDGGFKNNYMVEVCKRMLQKIPHFDKDVIPHIDSRIKYLRNKYNPIYEMLMQSGCQWDDVENKINCEKQWYDDWCKNHKNALGLWNMKFPYLRKLDLVWGKDRATGLKAEDISQACEDVKEKNNVLECSLSDSEDETIVVSDSQKSQATSSSDHTSPHPSLKRKKLLPRNEGSYRNKRCASLQQTIDMRLDDFTSKFELICGQMASQYGVAANAIVDANKPDSLSDAKMQEIINELLNVGISQSDVGKAAEFCYNDPAKAKVLFALPSHMRRSYVLGFLYPQI